MVVFKRVVTFAAIAAVAVMLASCERKITRIVETPQPLTCFSCHSDQNTTLVAAEQQWEHSVHASGGTLNENDGECKGCHTSEGFVARATGTTIPDVVENPTAIHCFTCHAPHTNGNFGVRWNTIATLKNGTTFDLHDANLCAACHISRRDVTTYVAGRVTLSSRWGPHHSPQADVLIGSNGYEYNGFTYEITRHRSATADGCLDCHFRTTSRNVVGGHSFNMEYVAEGDTIRNTDACSKCHDPITRFRLAFPGNAVQDTVDALAGQLKGLLQTAGLVSASGAPRSVTTGADSAGAVWNYLLVGVEDRSHGIHNPKYAVGLLKSAIQYMQGNLPQARMIVAKD